MSDQEQASSSARCRRGVRRVLCLLPPGQDRGGEESAGKRQHFGPFRGALLSRLLSTARRRGGL